jgi:hypothetical protein
MEWIEYIIFSQMFLELPFDLLEDGLSTATVVLRILFIVVLEYVDAVNDNLVEH